MNPGLLLYWKKVTFNLWGGLTTPMQLGPRKRIPYLLAVYTSCFSRFIPSTPISLKPPETTMACLMPCCRANPIPFLFPFSSIVIGTSTDNEDFIDAVNSDEVVNEQSVIDNNSLSPPEVNISAESIVKDDTA